MRTLVDRWKADLTLPEAWQDARERLIGKLKDLQRVLGILHGAVEYPTAQWNARVACSVNTSLTSTSAVDITGATYTFTPDVDMRLFVTVTFDAQCTLFGSIGHALFGWLVVNGVQQSPLCVSGFSALNDRRSIVRAWSISLKSGTAYTVKLQGATSNVGSNYIVYASQTDMILQTAPLLYKVP